MARHRIRYNARSARECARLDRIAETLPVLPTFTTRARPLDPAVWGRTFDGEQA
jgi:hypothetical protein